LASVSSPHATAYRVQPGGRAELVNPDRRDACQVMRLADQPAMEVLDGIGPADRDTILAIIGPKARRAPR
jgi:hypothetical protein